MKIYDLCLAWNWEFDADFVKILEAECARQDCSFLQITPENLTNSIHALILEEISFRAFFDRATDADSRFQGLEDWVSVHPVYQVNERKQTQWTHDKSKVHLAFLESGLATPFTYLLPSYSDQPEIPYLDLSKLGGRFAIKPATGSGGGEGVILEATNLDQVEMERKNHIETKYLLQTQMTPFFLNERQAWFRVLMCNDISFPCWWDPNTHRYTMVTMTEMDQFQLTPLNEIAHKIHSICKLDLFSCEVGITPTGEFLVVDYLNDPIDLRLQSCAYDGVPDEIVHRIATELVSSVKSTLRE